MALQELQQAPSRTVSALCLVPFPCLLTGAITAACLGHGFAAVSLTALTGVCYKLYKTGVALLLSPTDRKIAELFLQSRSASELFQSVRTPKQAADPAPVLPAPPTKALPNSLSAPLSSFAASPGAGTSPQHPCSSAFIRGQCTLG